MKKIIILIPVFNDWESLEKLIVEINENIKELKKIDIECIVINRFLHSPQEALGPQWMACCHR